jgi:hypothetical protein
MSDQPPDAPFFGVVFGVFTTRASGVNLKNDLRWGEPEAIESQRAAVNGPIVAGEGVVMISDLLGALGSEISDATVSTLDRPRSLETRSPTLIARGLVRSFARSFARAHASATAKCGKEVGEVEGAHGLSAWPT